MSKSRSIRRSGLRPMLLFGLISPLLVLPAAALAHPLDVYQRRSYIAPR